MPVVVADPVARARALIRPGQRRIIGITGAPGAGKSTLAHAVASAVGAVVVPMDGFHLAQRELARLGRASRKGAPDTFDAAGYVALLHRLRGNGEPVVYAPLFHREIEEPVAGAIGVPRGTPLVITEGNYLLLDVEPWSAVRPLLDEVWFVEVDEAVRRHRLIERRLSHGQGRAAAEAWADGSDQHNADLVAATRSCADVVVTG